MLAGFGPRPGSHFFAARSTWREFPLFFKNVEFAEMIREFSTFCEHVGTRHLRNIRIFLIFSRRERKSNKNPNAGWGVEPGMPNQACRIPWGVEPGVSNQACRIP